MTRSKLMRGGVIASVIWLIIGTVWALFRNSEDARLANTLARGSCRGRDDFSACLDAYYAANGSPGIDWSAVVLQLCIGLLIIWVVVFLIRMFGSKAN